MAEENRRREYCPTYCKGNNSCQLDVAITTENIGATEDEIPCIPTHSNEAEKPHWRQWCSEIKKKRFLAVPLVLFVATTLFILVGKVIYKSVYNN